MRAAGGRTHCAGWYCWSQEEPVHCLRSKRAAAGWTGMTTTLITGANKGLGCEAARQLIAAGHTVYLGARDQQRGKEAAGQLGARPLVIDVTSDDSVQAAAAHPPGGRPPRRLVNNAGVTGGRQPPGRGDRHRRAGGLRNQRLRRCPRHPGLPAPAPGQRRARHRERQQRPRVAGGDHRPERIESQFPRLAYYLLQVRREHADLAVRQGFPGIRINVVDPGYTATDLNGHQ